VFVNLFAGPRGQALTYPAVYDLIRRLRVKVGFSFGAHWLRHTAPPVSTGTSRSTWCRRSLTMTRR